jgi:hypothetical protein
MEINIGNIPHPAQQAVLDSTARFRVLMCGRRFGKSLIAQVIALLRCSEGKKVAYITPTYLLAGTFFDALTKELPAAVYRNASLKVIEFNGGQIRFFTGEKLDRLRGQSFHTVIIDEASFIPHLENGWLYSIRPTLTDYAGDAVFLSTPRGKNYFYSLFMQGVEGTTEWQSFKYDSYANPHIPKHEIDLARETLPEDVFRQEYLADPLDNAANPFGGTYIRQCVYPISTAPAVAYGVDLAKSVDWSVIIGIDANGSVCHYERFQRDWRITRQTISALPRIATLIDSTGVGDPIFEDLARDGRPVEGYKFTSHSKQQLMEGLVAAIQQRLITFPEGQITRELEVFEYQYTPHGVRYSAPSGFTDDCVMALGLAWHKYQRSRGAGKYTFV